MYQEILNFINCLAEQEDVSIVITTQKKEMCFMVKNKAEKNKRIYFENAGESKLLAVKTIKEVFNIGLKEAKDFVDNTPTHLPYVTQEEAIIILKQLKEIGASARLA